MSKRANRRAAARAGRRCPVCGEPIDAERSTAKFCKKPACKAKFHRDAKAARARGGDDPFADAEPARVARLSRGQLRIVRVLARARGPLTRYMIATRADVSPGHLSDLLGQVDARRRAPGSLLSLGHVREVTIEDVDCGTKRCYQITASGRYAIDPSSAFTGPFDNPETQAYLTEHAGDPPKTEDDEPDPDAARDPPDDW
jgi:hypothetical protein